MIKERTNATIQPLSKSQLLPDGWSPQEVDTFFNGLNEHQMQVTKCCGCSFAASPVRTRAGLADVHASCLGCAW
jgi:hypothetical protein